NGEDRYGEGVHAICYLPADPVRARGRSRSVNWPTPPFRQVLRLTDRIGLLEHADGVVPRHELGYRVEDVARGLVVVCREPSPRHELVCWPRRFHEEGRRTPRAGVPKLAVGFSNRIPARLSYAAVPMPVPDGESSRSREFTASRRRCDGPAAARRSSRAST